MRGTAAIFSAFLLISVSGVPTRSGHTLSHWNVAIIEELRASEGAERAWRVLDTASPECIEEKLKLSENGGKVMGRGPAMVLVMSAHEICVRDVGELSSILIDTLLAKMDEGERVECFVRELRELEPSASILEGVGGEGRSERCEEAFFRRFFVETVTNLMKIEELLCTPADQLEMKKFIYKLPILKHKTIDGDARRREMENMKTKFAEITQKIIDCGVSKL